MQFPSDCRDAATIEGLLNQHGEVPLPPYIDRHDPADAERYQTRYAERPVRWQHPRQDCTQDELLAALQDPIGADHSARGVRTPAVGT